VQTIAADTQPLSILMWPVRGHDVVSSLGQADALYSYVPMSARAGV
jgi:hypothetical protein